MKNCRIARAFFIFMLFTAWTFCSYFHVKCFFAEFRELSTKNLQFFFRLIPKETAHVSVIPGKKAHILEAYRLGIF